MYFFIHIFLLIFAPRYLHDNDVEITLYLDVLNFVSWKNAQNLFSYFIKMQMKLLLC